MKKVLPIIIFILSFCLLPKIASAGIIIRPVINTGLVGYWSFNEGTGTKVGDMSGYGNNGTWSGTGSHWTDGKIGKAGSFNGSSDYVDVPDTTGSPLDMTNQITVGAWIKPGVNITDYTRMVEKYYSTAWFIGTRGTGNNNLSVWMNGGERAYTTDDIYSPNTWNHVAFTYNKDAGSNQVIIYLNGSQVATGTYSTAIGTNNNSLRIGANDIGTYGFTGQIDEVRIYNRALSESEIQRLYKLSQPKIGMNRLGLVPDDLPSNATISYVRENCTGYSPCYTSLFDWEAAFGGFGWDGCTPGDLTCLDKTAVAKIDGTWNSPDTTIVAISGWTTDATRYIKIYTTAIARHPGKWDETKYRLEVTDSFAIGLSEEYTRIDGLQVKMTVATNYRRAIMGSINNANSDIRISNNIIRGVCSAPLNDCAGISNDWNSTGNYKIWNNILYDLNRGIYPNQGATDQIYNNTVVNCSNGYSINGTAIIIAKNNLAYNNTDNYADGGGSRWDDYSTNNLSGPSSDAYTPSANARNGVRVNFADEANDDFHLSPADSGARNYGADLSNDTSISFPFDIDRQSRDAKWDIGADEARGTVINASQNNQLTDGLVGFWSFNGPDIDGNLAYDRSTSGNNGTITGATPTDGKVGQAVGMSGNNSTKVIVADDPTLDMSDAVSICAWSRTNDFGRWRAIVDKSNGSYSEYWFGYGTADCPGLMLNPGDAADADRYYVYGTTAITDTGWHHICGVYNKTDVRIYLDGNLNNTPQSHSDTIYSGGGQLQIGQSTQWSYVGLDGAIDEVRVYNRVLSAQEIQRLYNLGR